MGHDQNILQSIGAGNLELSQFLPLAADSLHSAIDLLSNACDIFARHCVRGIEGDAKQCERHVHGSTALLTALVERIGYDAAEQLAREIAENPQNIRQLVVDRGLLSAEDFDQLTSPDHVTRLGSR
jgi:aspartate ammonia-lyase